ncbi:hypothetical protein, partial [Stenotrophomonas maltophilia group sp. RNC7]|uniref:hypothetical protein n=1 Tax=Stenotrophomonas maltophilia group sp. RNC7 TaxID=3071467 RepID=UPI0027E1459B
MRNDRDYFTKEDMELFISKYKIESSMTKVLDEFYDRKFKTPSEILKILGDDKEEILNKLENQIIKADNYIKNKSFNEALRIYSSLAMFYDNELILINCAMLSEIISNYTEAIDY